MTLTILALGVLSLGLVVTIDFVWEHQIQDFIIVDAATDLRKDLTTFHLWFEEYLNGDTTVDIEKNRELFIESKKLARALIMGGTVQTGFVLRPVENTKIRLLADEIVTLLDRLEDSAVERLRRKSSSGSGSAADQDFDRIFDETIAKTGALEEMVEKDILVTMTQIKRLYRIILTAWVIIVAGAVIGVGLLVRKRRLSDYELRSSEEKFRSLVDSTEDSIYLVDADCNYLFVNKKHMLRLGISGDSFLGRNYADFHKPEEKAEFTKRVERVISTGDSAQYEHQSLRDGRHFLQTFSPVSGSDGRIKAVTVVSKNISDRKQMEDELRALSLRDELTGLYNRRGFFTLAEQQLRIANRMKKKLYLLLADLDDLKIINDTFGHQEGDAALVESALVLKDIFRESDIIARIGGDEFVVLPIEMTEDRSEAILNRLNQGLEKNNEKNQLRYRISISTGIAMYDPGGPCSIELMLSQADARMYEQKRLRKSAAGESG